MSRQLVVMGVSGSGKSTLAQALSSLWAVPYIEGDDLHAQANVAKMAAGIALDDSDRWPWLDRIGAAIVASRDSNGGAIASCSALRCVYRDHLRAAVGPQLRFVMIDLPRPALEQRMSERTGHYMPPSLLESQLRTLEHPRDEGDVLVVEGANSIDEMVEAIEAWRLMTRGETLSSRLLR